MKQIAALLAFIASAAAAPALVWKEGASNAPVHSSEDVTPAAIFGDLLSSAQPNDSSLSSVVFLLERGDKGSERLSTLASQGSLPGVAAKYDEAHAIHHHVSGVLNAPKVAAEATRVGAGHNIVQLSLSEFSSTQKSVPEEVEVSGSGILSRSAKLSKKRSKAIANAHVFIVTVDASTEPAEIDSIVVDAIENKSIRSVILSAVRSVDEVKLERNLENRRRLKMQEAAGRRMLAAKEANHRRLEDQDQQQDDQEQNQDDMSGIVYVSMTPNILAGILFFFLFTFVTYIGIGCMGAIAGGEVLKTTKMPSVGREM